MKIADLFILTSPNRFHRVWKAQLARTSISADAKTSDDAIAAVIKQIQRQDQYGNMRTYRFATNGAVFCLYFAFDNWCYDIVNPTNQLTPSSCHLSAVTYETALDQMNVHVAQYGA